MSDTTETRQAPKDVKLDHYTRLGDLPSWLTKSMLIDAFHHKMKPFQDAPEDVEAAIDYALSVDASKYGGFLITATHGQELLGGLIMLKTGMKGYIPPWILLMVYVDPSLRGQGIGAKIIDFARQHCDGDIKLHVEYDNPARRLYERVGFTTKYAEMRLINR